MNETSWRVMVVGTLSRQWTDQERETLILALPGNPVLTDGEHEGRLRLRAEFDIAARSLASAIGRGAYLFAVAFHQHAGQGEDAIVLTDVEVLAASRVTEETLDELFPDGQPGGDIAQIKASLEASQREFYETVARRKE